MKYEVYLEPIRKISESLKREPKTGSWMFSMVTG